MDPDVLRYLANVDQTKATVRETVNGMDASELCQLVRDCGAGRLAELDEPVRLLVGLLAIAQIFDICDSLRLAKGDANPDET